MKIYHCQKCDRDTYHFINLIYSGRLEDVITTTCVLTLTGKTGCYKQTTYFAPQGTWYKTVTGGKDENN